MRRYCTRRPGRNVLAMREFTHGDVAIQMAAAPIRVGGRFRFHRKTPVAIENRACLAEYDRGHSSLTLTVSTQIPGIIRDILADLLEVPGHSVRVVAPDVGGGFAGEASLYPEEIRRFGARPAPRPDRALDGRPRPGTRDYVGTSRCRRTRRPDRRHRDPAERQYRRSPRHRDQCEPHRGSGRRSGRLGGAAAQGKGNSSGLTPSSRRRPRISKRTRGGCSSSVPIVR
jgi:hypothetical protein